MNDRTWLVTGVSSGFGYEIDVPGVQDTVKEAFEKHGKVDVVVSNAGYITAAQRSKLMSEYESCHGFLNMLDASKGLAPGDPVKMAERIIESVDMEKAPLQQTFNNLIRRLDDGIQEFLTRG